MGREGYMDRLLAMLLAAGAVLEPLSWWSRFSCLPHWALRHHSSSQTLLKYLSLSCNNFNKMALTIAICGVCVCVCVCVCVASGWTPLHLYSNLTFSITLNCLPSILIDAHLYITAVLGNLNHSWSNYSSLGLRVFYNQNDYMLFLRFWDTDSIQRRLLARKAGRKEGEYIPDSAPFEGEKLWGEWLCTPRPLQRWVVQGLCDPTLMLWCSKLPHLP